MPFFRRGHMSVAIAFLLATSFAHANTWGVLTRDGGGRQVAPYLSSLASGEPSVGALRSTTFKLDADTISFTICGWDGAPGQPRLRNHFALCDAESGLALRQVSPPATDAMTPVHWDVVELIGRQVYFRAIDGVSDQAFAWMGVADVRVGDRDLTPRLTPGHLPAGWTEESRPPGLSVDDWLACKPASSRLAIEMDSTAPTWGVITINGERRECKPYLSSLRGGETGTGAVRSPVFVLASPKYTFVAMGADSPTCDAGLNSFQLVDATTFEVLRTAEPPGGNTLVPLSWNTSDLVGRRVFFRAVDTNTAGGYAWMGCDDVPLGAGKVAHFADSAALTGWREEGQPESLLAGVAAAPRSLREMVEAEWLNEDVRRGVRWSLWEQNPPAAPYLLHRLVVIMDADFARARSLLRDFAGAGVKPDDLAAFRATFTRLNQRFSALQGKPQGINDWQSLRHDQRVALRDLAFRNPRLSFPALLFVKRFTQQSYSDINVNHHAWGSRPGGDLCLLTGFGANGDPKVRPLLSGRLGPGNVHGIDLDFDASRIVFAYAQSLTDQPPDGWLSRQATFDLHRTVGLLHLYEMSPDGSRLTQLTRGEWSDLNPCYLPNGDLAFESERCALEIECNEGDKDEPTTNLYAYRRAGGTIDRLTLTKDGDWYPRVLPDGSIVYSHWEYQERSLMFMHSLWFCRPDGTGADNFVKQHFDYPVTLTVPRPIPGSEKLLAIAGGHHTLAAGPVVIVDRAKGMNNPDCLERVTGPDVWPELGGAAPGPSTAGWHASPGQGWYMDPYPLSATTYLASYCDGGMQDEAGYALYLMDVYGGKELLYRDPSISSVMPIPLKPRMRPPNLWSNRDPKMADARLIATNVASGVEGVAPGEVKFLRIAEPVPWSYSNVTGGQRYDPDAKATGVNWTPVRILGTVPVEADGSAQFRVPADTGLYFQALDAQGREVRRMRTYISFRAGEVRSCTGCHETRNEAPSIPRSEVLACRHDPSIPTPPPWGDRPLSFLRDVQPIFNRHCLSCHTGLKPAGGVDLSPGLTESNNRAYDTLLDPARNLVTVASKGDDTRITPVRAFGSQASRLVDVIRHSAGAALTDDEWRRLYMWMDANAVYHDDFLRKRPPSELPYSIVEDKDLWTRIAGVEQRRCASCHSGANLARPEWVDLDDPSRSLFLTAPLAGSRTPTGKHCDPAPFADRNDPDYAAMLSWLKEAAQRSWDHPRRDLRCFVAQPSLRRDIFFGFEPLGRTARLP